MPGIYRMSKTIVTFEAALPTRGKALSIDADGEAVLVLTIPASDAPKIMAAYSDLQDRSFVVAFVDVSKNEGKTDAKG